MKNLLYYVRSFMALLMLSINAGCVSGDEDAAKKSNFLMAAKNLEEVKTYFSGENKTCIPLSGMPIDNKYVKVLMGMTEKDIYEIIYADEFRMAMSFRAHNGSAPLSLNVSLRDGKCKDFDVTEIYSDPV